jgi:iron complex outermembrane receptor protein
MYTPLNRVEVGNPHLKAEASHTWEVVFDYRANRDLNMAVNLFDYQIKDKIQRRLINFADRTIYTYDNVGLLEGRGFELESRWRVTEGSTLEASYAYADVTNNSGMEAGNYPHHHFYLQHDWSLNVNWSLNTQWNWVVDRKRPIGDVREKLQDYTELDLTLRYQSLQMPWSSSMGVRNLLDEDRREPGDPRLIGDYPKAGREWFCEVRYQF